MGYWLERLGEWGIGWRGWMSGNLLEMFPPSSLTSSGPMDWALEKYRILTISHPKICVVKPVNFGIFNIMFMKIKFYDQI